MESNVLVPLDDSPQSWDALDYALAEFPDAEIHVLHVVDPVSSVLSGTPLGTADARSRAEERAENVVEEAREAADAVGVSLTAAIETGRPAREIVAFASEHPIDHIVMGSHGRDRVARVLLGSVTETVVRRADVPVTVVR
ncbi:MAG: universal stress protein [Haloarculaceae archaeon]